ncbi:MAG: signal peptidase [Planctomycetaceae bacterium]|jgi:cell fate regulator YaaT (PSP1 superfamily)|nr:signal peptidase [Planctomycetaceae bacterium]
MEIVKYIVRYGAMRIRSTFASSLEERLRHGDRVLVRTERGLEVGVVLRETDSAASAVLDADSNVDVNSDLDSGLQIDSGAGAGNSSGCEVGFRDNGLVVDRILRLMTPEDNAELNRIREVERVEFARCREIVRQMNLVMDLVRVERIFSGERLIVYYVAEGRVDFRELVKLLASEFQTRIEMRQIGVRDETRLLADFGDCGMEVCCNLYLKDMLPVSMKMAKLQKATLDPNKVSGRCGRLKCCLRYEYDHYLETQKKLPSVGTEVTTPVGDGKVVAHELLANKVLVEINELGRKLFCPMVIKIKENVTENIK